MKIKIKSVFFVVVLIAFLTVFVSAAGFSPVSLTYNLSIGQEQCQKILITSDSPELSVMDTWAENKDVEWKIKLFNASSSQLGLKLEYPIKLSSERQFEVCLTGLIGGEYHGIILVKEQQVGNSVVQLGIWIKAIINGSNLFDGSKSHSLSNLTMKTTDELPNNPPITGKVISAEESESQNLGFSSISIIIGILVLILILIILLIIFKRRQRKRQFGY